jgi:hypothetical protein
VVETNDLLGTAALLIFCFEAVRRVRAKFLDAILLMMKRLWE